MADLVGGPHRRLVDLDPETGSGQPLDVALDEGQRGDVDQVVEDVGPEVVVDADALLLDEVVRRRERDLQGGRQGQRPEGAVGSQRGVERLDNAGLAALSVALRTLRSVIRSGQPA